MSKVMALKAGDVFVVKGAGIIPRLINGAQRFWAKDGSSVYSHAGIVLTDVGATLEALPNGIRLGNLSKYNGKRIKIARYTPLTSGDFERAKNILLEEDLGRVYPAWRLFLHLFPPLARRVSYRGKWLVCSELVGKYLALVGAREYNYKGVNPDTLADEWDKWRDFETVYEGSKWNLQIGSKSEKKS